MNHDAIPNLFYDQCVGMYSGHMAAIPNNPVIRSLVIASVGGNDVTRHEFAEFLREVADALSAGPEF